MPQKIHLRLDVSSIIETDIEIQTENLPYKTRRFARSAWISQIKQPTDSAEEPKRNAEDFVCSSFIRRLTNSATSQFGCFDFLRHIHLPELVEHFGEYFHR